MDRAAALPWREECMPFQWKFCWASLPLCTTIFDRESYRPQFEAYFPLSAWLSRNFVDPARKSIHHIRCNIHCWAFWRKTVRLYFYLWWARQRCCCFEWGWSWCRSKICPPLAEDHSERAGTWVLAIFTPHSLKFWTCWSTCFGRRS